jgi:hypothetical protein
VAQDAQLPESPCAQSRQEEAEDCQEAEEPGRVISSNFYKNVYKLLYFKKYLNSCRVWPVCLFV